LVCEQKGGVAKVQTGFATNIIRVAGSRTATGAIDTRGSSFETGRVLKPDG